MDLMGSWVRVAPPRRQAQTRRNAASGAAGQLEPRNAAIKPRHVETSDIDRPLFLNVVLFVGPHGRSLAL